MKLTAPRDRRLTKGVIIGAAGLALLVGEERSPSGSTTRTFPEEPSTLVSSHLALTGAGAWHADTCGGTTIPDIALT